jgi:hypothetical protein
MAEEVETHPSTLQAKGSNGIVGVSPNPASPARQGDDSLPAKRASPWRQPKSVREANAAAAEDNWSRPASTAKSPSGGTKVIMTKPNERVTLRKLFQDVVSVKIPIGVTANLGEAVQRTRTKRIEELHKFFPALSTPEREPVDQADGLASDVDDGKGEATAVKGEDDDDKKGTTKPRKKLRNVPQLQDYANVLDYLEAKYAQGVMIDDEDASGDGDASFGGSVYSTTSFLDDDDLQRTVAEQVLAHTTTTKVELQDDDEFFVNVGDLEVEETELTHQHYDPLDDTLPRTPVKRKRKKPPAPTEEKDSEGESNVAKTAVLSRPDSSPQKKQKTAEKEEKADTIIKKNDAPASGAPAEESKKLSDKMYAAVVQMIKDAPPGMMPRQKTKERVTVTCPLDKGPGDSIMFANPHVPGQRLKVKVPKSAKPGGTFKVTVPVALLPTDDDTDHNKLTREFYDAVDEYARAFDDWCDAEGEYRKEIGDKNFVAHFEKRKKFDSLVEEFPKDLFTPVDKTYLQKILRRARQNRHKRKVTLSKQVTKPPDDELTLSRTGSFSEAEKKDDISLRPLDEEDKLKKMPPPNDVSVAVPSLETTFSERSFNLDDFLLQ